MLYGRHAYISLSQNSAALGVNHLFGDGINDGLTFEVNTLNTIAGVLWCGIECHCKVETSVESLS